MKQKTYCPECGTKMEYAGKMPNFCTNCGYALSSAAQSRSKGPVGQTGEPGVEVEYDNEEGDYQFEAEGLDVEIVIDENAGGSKIGDLVGTRPEGLEPPPPLKGRKGRPRSKKRVQQDFSKEAGAIREGKRKEG